MNKQLYNLFRWKYEANRETLTRESLPKNIHINNVKIIIFGVISSLYSLLSWRLCGKKYIFVDNIDYPDSLHNKSEVLLPNRKNLMLGLSLVEFDAIFYLINKKRSFIRNKLLIYFIVWSRILNLIVSKKIFINTQDYFFKSSIILSLGCFKVIGIQHGLMKINYLKKSKIYPGCRNKIILSFSEEYNNALKKNANQKIYEIGPLIDISIQKLDEKITTNKEAIFISSGDLMDVKKISILKNISKKLAEKGYDFKIKLHPQEIQDNDDFEYYLGSARDLYLKNTNTIFIGFYSTLLYNLTHYGFRTYWLNYEIDKEDLNIISKLNNSKIINLDDINFDLLYLEKNKYIYCRKFYNRFIQLMNNINYE